MHKSWLTPDWSGRRRIEHPVNWARLPEYDIGVAQVQTKVDHGHENRWYLYVRKFNEADVKAFPVLASTVITSSPGSTQTITSDATWNNASNSIECIGAGARGAIGASTSTSGGGGGGGAYTKITNASITTPGTTQYFAQVGGVTATNGSGGGDSWWTLTSPGTSFPSSGTAVGAKGAAALATATSATGGLGGASSGSYPSGAGPAAKSNGGAGGNAAAALANAGGGGGGAGGATGDGATVGGTGPTAGGAGNANSGGGGTGGGVGSPGVAGGAGTNIQTGPNAGSGGGGGGGNASPSTGGAGGNYGGGGGGGGRSTGTGGQGAQGVIVLTWTPIPPAGTLVVTEAADTAAFPSGNVAWNTTLAAQEGNVYALLLHFDGVNASTTIVDSGGKNQTVTAHGSAQIDTSQPVFSNSALKLPAGGDYLDVAFSTDFIFGNGDFTIDFRARLTSGSTAQTFYDGGTSGFKIFYDGTALKFTSAAGTITGGALASNTNYHIAVTRAAGSTRMWLNGVQTGSTLSDATVYLSSTGYPQIGDGVAVASGSLVVTEAADTAVLTGSAAGGLDAATTAWIAAVGSGNVDTAHRGYVDTLIVGLKSDGIWSKLDRLWLYAAQNTASALVDIVATSMATASNSPAFTADRGYAGNGSTANIDTGFNPASGTPHFARDSACAFGWSNTSGLEGAGFLGQGFSPYYTRLFPAFTDGNCYWNINSQGTISVANAGATGLYSMNRSGSTQANIYLNGSSLGTTSDASVAFASSDFFALVADASGALFSAKQISCMGMGGSLTATEQGNLYSRLRTYMTSVGVP